MLRNTPFTHVGAAAILTACAVGMLASAYSLGAATATNITQGSGASCSWYDQKYCMGWASNNQQYSWCCPIANTCGDVTVTDGVATATCN